MSKIQTSLLIMTIIALSACGKNEDEGGNKGHIQKNVANVSNICQGVDFSAATDSYVREKVHAFHAEKMRTPFTVTKVVPFMSGHPTGEPAMPVYLIQAEYQLSTGLKGEIVEAGYITEQCTFQSTIMKIGPN